MKLIEFTQNKDAPTYDLKIEYVGYEACKPSHQYGPAVRQHHLIHYIKNGKGIYKFKDRIIEVGKNELFYIPPNEVTFYKADNNNPWNYFWFGFSGECSKELLKSIGFNGDNRKIKYNLTSSYAVNDTIQELAERKILKQSDKIFELAKLYEIFSWLRKSYETNTEKTAYESSDKSLLKAAEEYIKRSYMQDITIEDVVSHIGVERTQIYRYFKKAYDISPKEYLIKLQMGEAVKLLRQTQLSIKQISYSVGYLDQYLFSKMFKKIHGMSPKHFRQKL